jgi:hypothetical protein
MIMPSLTVLIQNGAVCQRLRDKKMSYEIDAPAPANAMDIIPESERAAALPSGPFWCVQTQSAIGPDDAFANVENCRPGRGCCETT